MPVHRFLILPLLGWTIASAGCDQEPPQPVVEERVLPVSAMTVQRQSSFVYPSTYYGRIEPARRAALSFDCRVCWWRSRSTRETKWPRGK